jgi:hypothetical protein
LHSNTEEDDEQAMREAGITAAERYKAELQKQDGAKEASTDITFDIDQIMHDPGSKTRQKSTAHVNRARVQLQANAVQIVNQARREAPRVIGVQAGAIPNGNQAR